MEIFEVVVNLLNEFILEKAFYQKYPLKTRLPYMILYETVMILLLALAIFLGIHIICHDVFSIGISVRKKIGIYPHLNQ